MKSLGQNLYIRHNSFYYRSVVSRQFHNLLRYKEIVLSLGGMELEEARLKCAQIKYRESKAFRTFKNGIRSELPCDGLPKEAFLTLVKELDALKTTLSSKEHFKGLHNILNPDKAFPLFSEIKGKYLADCLSDAPNTRLQKDKTLQMFIELLGDKPLRQVGKEDARQFKSLLMSIPANAKKKYKIQSLAEINWTELEGVQGQHPKTINNRMAYLVAFFNWAIRQDYYQGDNPFSKLMVKNHKTLSERRHPYTAQELTTLFHSPIYSGCRGESWIERMQAGDIIIKDSLYWVPLIALYSGMRLNEIQWRYRLWQQER